MSYYFDTNATTPVDPRVADIVMKYLTDEYGNPGSRTHSYGSRAAKAVELARDQIANTLNISSGRVVFTSGATESNNLTILGLRQFARAQNRSHIISTAIEHKAVLEPMQQLSTDGFEVEFVKPNSSGCVTAKDVLSRVRHDTLLVSVMHVNNETGMVQPISEIARGLADFETLFHVDAAQGFGKDLMSLADPSIDFISISAHKIYGPKGVGALVIRDENKKKKKLTPLIVGGGQEFGLRPGTLPVPLIAGFGLAAEIATKEHDERNTKNLWHMDRILNAATSSGALINGDPAKSIGNVLNVSFPGVDSESAMLIMQDDVAISNGAACSSSSYSYSHVLEAMDLPGERIESALRISWYHDSERVDWSEVFRSITALME